MLIAFKHIKPSNYDRKKQKFIMQSTKQPLSYATGLVSVLIPVFNRVDFIEKTLASVYSQTYTDIEIVVVDDGSTDGSYEILERHNQQNKIKLFVHNGHANKGQSASLNLALFHASGEFVAILDSDDIFMPDKLTAQVDYLNKNKEIGLVYGQGEAIDADDKHLYYIDAKFDKDPNDPNEILLDCYFLLPQNSLVRHKCYEKAGKFNEQYRAAQDHDMLIRIAEITNIGAIPDRVFQYRRHENSISQKGLYKRWKTGFVILRNARKRYNYKLSTILGRKAVLHFRMFQVYMSKNSKSLYKAISHLLLAFIYHPSRGIKTAWKYVFRGKDILS